MSAYRFTGFFFFALLHNHCYSLHKTKRAREGAVLDISLGGEVRPGPSHPDHDFPTLFKTEFRFLIPCLTHLTRNHTLCKKTINKNFAVV